ncbi:MAG: iron ABC transporter permease [Lachnospiraceae bacterium]|nr:iron ABC transporter permease [Lachnospiraceae bacterium]
MTGSILILLVALCASIFIGNDSVRAGELINALFGGGKGTSAELILYKVRIPRALAALFCGGGLAVAGLLLQLTLNNTLASPGVLGINAGAGFFVLLAGLVFPYSVAAKQLSAFLGALLTALFVYGISYKAGVSKTTLILSGVAVSSLFAAGSNTIITIFPSAVTDKNAFSLGGLSGATGIAVAVTCLMIIAGTIFSLILSRGIGLFSLGDEVAAGLGLNINLYRLLAIICAAFISAAAVSVCGLISFVGLLVPNLVRMITKPRTLANIFLCFFAGGILLLICDTLARQLFYPYELPVGLFLSFLGAPFFIYILIVKRRRLSL